MPLGTSCIWEGSVSRFSDKVLVCRDCGNEFVFSAGEQEFYSTRGFSEPTRCAECRAATQDHARRGAPAGQGSGASTGDDRSGGYGGRESTGSMRSGPRQMFKVVCAECGQETEGPIRTPFRPSGLLPRLLREAQRSALERPCAGQRDPAPDCQTWLHPYSLGRVLVVGLLAGSTQPSDPGRFIVRPTDMRCAT